MRTVSWAEAADRVATVVNTAGEGAAAAVVSSFACEYRAGTDRLASVRLADGRRWTYDYDESGQLTAAACRDADGSLGQGPAFRWQYDSIGNPVAGGPVDTLTGLVPHAFSADNLNFHVARVWGSTVEFLGTAAPGCAVTVEGQGRIARASVDRSGRFLARLDTGNARGSRQLEAKIRAVRFDGVADVIAEQAVTVALPPPTETVTADATGNLLSDGTFTYLFDAFNRLLAVESQPSLSESERVRVEHEYYPDGRRAVKRVSHRQGGAWAVARTHRFVYDGWNPVLERIEDADGTVVTRQYLWGLDLAGQRTGRPGTDAGGIGGLLAIVTDVGGVRQTYVPVFDHAGNVVQLLDAATRAVAAEYRYSPFGEVLAAMGPAADACPFRFSTKYWDAETGLYYYGYRYYCPRTAKWLNRDPLGEAGGLNLTAFCRNDPVNAVDPLGLAEWQRAAWGPYPILVPTRWYDWFWAPAVGAPATAINTVEALALQPLRNVPAAVRKLDEVTSDFLIDHGVIAVPISEGLDQAAAVGFANPLEVGLLVAGAAQTLSYGRTAVGVSLGTRASAGAMAIGRAGYAVRKVMPNGRAVGSSTGAMLAGEQPLAVRGPEQLEFGFVHRMEDYNPRYVMYKAAEFGPGTLKKGEYTLNLPFLKNAKGVPLDDLNWYQNQLELSKAHRLGRPIREVNPSATGGWLERERVFNVFSGWEYKTIGDVSVWVKGSR